MLAFVIISVFIVATAIFVMWSKHLVHSAVALFASFLGIAALYLLLALEFLAFVQIFLFVGTISILILFALMMIGEYGVKESNLTGQYAKWAYLIAILFFVFLESFFVQFTKYIPSTSLASTNSVAILGERLLHQLIVPFEVISFVLLAALIGTVALIKQKR